MMFVKKPTADDVAWRALLAALPPPMDAEWADLIDKARTGRQKLIADFDSGKDVEVSSALYSRYKEFLLKLFNNKCAYCESIITNAQPGDVEHFRPKGRVVDDNFKPILVRLGGKQVQHPGYYWLAYEWSNLLPSCADCNRFRLHGEKSPGTSRAEIGAGKADRFPLRDEAKRAVVPDSEAGEEALLIDPTRIDPSQHLEFLSNGTIRPKTEEGKATLQVFGLNLRENLVEQRALAYQDGEAAFEKYLTAIVARNVDRQKAAGARVNRMYKCKESYSTMQRLAIDDAMAYLSQQSVKIELPRDEIG